MCPASSFDSKFETFLSSNVSNWFNWLLFSGTALTRHRKVRMVRIQCADILNCFTMMTSPTLHDEAQSDDWCREWCWRFMSCSSSRPPSSTQSLKFGNKKQSATCLRCFAALIPPLISNSFLVQQVLWPHVGGECVMMFGPQLGSCSFGWAKTKQTRQASTLGIKLEENNYIIWFVWALQRHEFTSFAPLNECPQDPIPTVLIRWYPCRIRSIFNTLHCRIILGLLEGFPRNKNHGLLVIPKGP